VDSSRDYRIITGVNSRMETSNSRDFSNSRNDNNRISREANSSKDAGNSMNTMQKTRIFFKKNFSELKKFRKKNGNK
jgi:hypothetical protein